MVIVIATVELKEGGRDQFLEEFQKIVPLVRDEEGCIEYGPTIDAETEIGAQIPRRDNIVVIVEKWESLETLEAHLIAPHMMEYRPKVKPLITNSQLQILQPVES